MLFIASSHFGKPDSSVSLVKYSTIFLTLVIVPANIPTTPRISRNMFLAIFNFPDNPWKSSQKTIVCIKAGAINANVDELTEPISEMNKSICGIAAASATIGLKQV